jgi:hypothetical protein
MKARMARPGLSMYGFVHMNPYLGQYGRISVVWYGIYEVARNLSTFYNEMYDLIFSVIRQMTVSSSVFLSFHYFPFRSHSVSIKGNFFPFMVQLIGHLIDDVYSIFVHSTRSSNPDVWRTGLVWRPCYLPS